MDFWRIFENFWLCLFLPTFRVFGDFQNLTFARSLAAVATFVLAQKAHPTVTIEDIKGLWNCDIGRHGSDWPCEEVVQKMEPTVFWDRGCRNLLRIKSLISILYQI